MKRSRVVAAGAERAAEMRVGWKETIALSPGSARSRLPWSRPVQGLGPAARLYLSSLAGLTSLWRNASSSRLRLGVSSAECGYSFPVHLAYFFEVLGLQLSIRHWRSSTFSGPARGPAGPKEPGREGRGTARRGEGQDFDCGGRRHGMAISTMFRRVRVLGPGTVLPSIRRRASRLMSLSLTG